MALNFPDPATQTPVNTFSPSSTPSASTNGITYLWDGQKWNAQTNGDAAFWQRVGTTLSPATVGDNISTTGDLTTADATVDTLTSNGLVDAPVGTFSGDVQVGSLNSGPLAAYRNQLLNPYIEIHQRGTSTIDTPAVLAKAHYTGADRWAVIPRRSNDVITSKVFNNIIPNSENAPNNNALYVTSTASTNSFNVCQFIELPASCLGPFQPGSKWTLTVLIRSASVFDLGATLVLSSGSDLGSAGFASPTNGNQTLAVGWNTVSFNFTLPTDGTWVPGQPCLMVRLDIGADSTEREVWLGAAQLEPGPVRTPWEVRPTSVELAACQRYYWRQSADPNFSTTITNGIVWGTGTFIGVIRYPTVMRAKPDGSILDFTGIEIFVNANNIAASGGQIQTTGTRSAEFSLPLSSAQTSSDACFARLTASSTNYFDLDAEF